MVMLVMKIMIMMTLLLIMNRMILIMMVMRNYDEDDDYVCDDGYDGDDSDEEYNNDDNDFDDDDDDDAADEDSFILDHTSQSVFISFPPFAFSFFFFPSWFLHRGPDLEDLIPLLQPCVTAARPHRPVTGLLDRLEISMCS